MRIPELMAGRRPFLSLEFFPPKEREAWPGFFEVAEQLKALDPLFVSVTYGAGGSTQENTLEIVRGLKARGFEPLTHLTCVGATGEHIDSFLDALAEAGVDNVLALRGDPPRNNPDFDFSKGEFQHASDLVEFIRERHPEMAVGAAAYPECHPESCTISEDLKWTRHKLDAGADFLVTQLFFDNRQFFDYVERIGRDKPVIPGVLPILSLKSAKFVLSLCNAAIPGNYLAALEKANDDGGDEAVREVGLAYAKKQAQELLDGGAPGVHLYTLNKAEACLEIGGSLNFEGGRK